jgi:hypothetical protein
MRNTAAMSRYPFPRQVGGLYGSSSRTYCIGGQSMTNRIDYPRNQTNERTDHGTNIRHQNAHNHSSFKRRGGSDCADRYAGHVVHPCCKTRSIKLFASRFADSRAAEINRQTFRPSGYETSRKLTSSASKNGQDGAFISGPLPFLRRLASADFSHVAIGGAQISPVDVRPQLFATNSATSCALNLNAALSGDRAGADLPLAQQRRRRGELFSQRIHHSPCGKICFEFHSSNSSGSLEQVKRIARNIFSRMLE